MAKKSTNVVTASVSKVKKHLTPKRVAIIMAVVSLVSFLYKFVLGVLTPSALLIVASFPTAFVFICKSMYAKHMDATRKQKKKGYLIMTIGTAAFAVLFFLFSSLKIGGIDITIKNNFNGWIGLIFIFFIILMFILSIINLKGALNKTDLIVIGIKEITFESALADGVMIEEFLYRVILHYLEDKLPILEYIDRSFGMLIGLFMLAIPLIMFKRWKNYDPEMKYLNYEENVNIDVYEKSNELRIRMYLDNTDEIKKDFEIWIAKKLKPVKNKYKIIIHVFFDHIDKKAIEPTKLQIKKNLKGKLNCEVEVYQKIKLKFVKC